MSSASTSEENDDSFHNSNNNTSTTTTASSSTHVFSTPTIQFETNLFGNNRVPSEIASVRRTCCSFNETILGFGSDQGNIYLHDRFNLELKLTISYSEISQKRPNTAVSITKLALTPNLIPTTVGGDQTTKRKLFIGAVDSTMMVYILEVDLHAQQIPNTDMVVFIPKASRLLNTHNQHKSEITSMVWSNDFSRIFTGDASGLVLEFKNQKKSLLSIGNTSQVLKEEGASIVQLACFGDHLLVSSTKRSIDVNLSAQQYKGIGTKPRDGQFGACFQYAPKKKDENSASTSAAQDQFIQYAYSARPGRRIWCSDITTCKVLSTLKFTSVSQLKDLKFTYLLPIGPFLASYNEESIAILDIIKLKILDVRHNIGAIKSAFCFGFTLFLIHQVNNDIPIVSRMDIELAESEKVFFINQTRPRPKPMTTGVANPQSPQKKEEVPSSSSPLPLLVGLLKKGESGAIAASPPVNVMPNPSQPQAIPSKTSTTTQLSSSPATPSSFLSGRSPHSSLLSDSSSTTSTSSPKEGKLLDFDDLKTANASQSQAIPNQPTKTSSFSFSLPGTANLKDKFADLTSEMMKNAARILPRQDSNKEINTSSQQQQTTKTSLPPSSTNDENKDLPSSSVTSTPKLISGTAPPTATTIIANTSQTTSHQAERDWLAPILVQPKKVKKKKKKPERLISFDESSEASTTTLLVDNVPKKRTTKKRSKSKDFDQLSQVSDELSSIDKSGSFGSDDEEGEGTEDTMTSASSFVEPSPVAEMLLEKNSSESSSTQHAMDNKETTSDIGNESIDISEQNNSKYIVEEGTSIQTSENKSQSSTEQGPVEPNLEGEPESTENNSINEKTAVIPSTEASTVETDATTGSVVTQESSSENTPSLEDGHVQNNEAQPITETSSHEDLDTSLATNSNAVSQDIINHDEENNKPMKTVHPEETKMVQDNSISPTENTPITEPVQTSDMEQEAELQKKLDEELELQRQLELQKQQEIEQQLELERENQRKLELERENQRKLELEQQRQIENQKQKELEQRLELERIHKEQEQQRKKEEEEAKRKEQERIANELKQKRVLAIEEKRTYFYENIVNPTDHLFEQLSEYLSNGDGVWCPEFLTSLTLWFDNFVKFIEKEKHEKHDYCIISELVTKELDVNQQLQLSKLINFRFETLFNSKNTLNVDDINHLLSALHEFLDMPQCCILCNNHKLVECVNTILKIEEEHGYLLEERNKITRLLEQYKTKNSTEARDQIFSEIESLKNDLPSIPLRFCSQLTLIHTGGIEFCASMFPSIQVWNVQQAMGLLTNSSERSSSIMPSHTEVCILTHEKYLHYLTLVYQLNHASHINQEFMEHFLSELVSNYDKEESEPIMKTIIEETLNKQNCFSDCSTIERTLRKNMQCCKSCLFYLYEKLDKIEDLISMLVSDSSHNMEELISFMENRAENTHNWICLLKSIDHVKDEKLICTKEQAIFLMCKCLGSMQALNILQDLLTESSSCMQDVDPIVYSKICELAKAETEQSKLRHNMIEIVDSYMWSEKEECISPQVRSLFAFQSDAPSSLFSPLAPSEESFPYVQSFFKLAPNQTNNFHSVLPRFAEDCGYHWGAQIKVGKTSRCFSCRLPLSERVGSDVLVFSCGHCCHRTCNSLEVCSICKQSSELISKK
ncbi:hypothetical protein C9374_005978 [Naegleria lovaniensis]|uniref:RING-type domain-containing protein n=1 Tax=Naegleria lovaniensis TaxID=51637 RepID=A0AA88GMA8_NAELO|nr:uncharacterized protein C9374_005978 [Naegleria lovaniensis]KAG2381594.1 hypothetical protein C9374_005978 [Naegleria lovaniensis]